jgi:hypothetical protein
MDTQPRWNNYRVDFREKAAGKQRFSKGFTFTLANDREEAKRNILKHRKGSVVEFLEVQEWER